MVQVGGISHNSLKLRSPDSLVRVTSALSSRKESPIPRNDASIPGSAGRANGTHSLMMHVWIQS